jgi:serine protease Do
VHAAGTGFIIDKAGLILTNNHVVEGANKIEVSLYGERRSGLRSQGRRPRPAHRQRAHRADGKPDSRPAAIKFGDSSQMEAGDWVMAIGNPFGLAHTVSVGVISATQRPFETSTQRSSRCSRPTRRSTRATPAVRC